MKTLAAPGPALDLGPAVVERARRGEQDAFAALVRHYDRGLRALAFRLLGDRDRMDDALQETYVKAFRALPRLRGDSTLGTWLYRIAYNACLDELERSRRSAVAPLRDLPEHSTAYPDPGEAVAARGDLAAAFAHLAPEERAAVLLVDAEGFDYAAAAEVLGIPVGTVASRLNRARSTLRRALAENSFHDGASSPGCDGRCEGRTQGVPISEDMGATEDAASCRPARPGGTAPHCESGSESEGADVR